MNALEVRGVSKAYGDIAAVKDVNIVIPGGIVCGVIGKNGAGKSTIVRMISGLAHPDSGEIRVFEEPAGSPAAVRLMGVSHEHPRFYRWLTGRRNLSLLSDLRRAPEGSVGEALAAVALEPSRWDDKVKTYSQGMARRLSIAAALLAKPRLVILDEPTNGLDVSGILALRQIIERLRDGGAAVLLCSHLLGEVERLCDDVVVLEEGAATAAGALSDLLGQPRILIGVGHDDRIAAELILRDAGVVVEVVDGALVAAGGGHDASRRLIEILVAGGVTPAEVRTLEGSLEEKFFGEGA